MKLYFCEVKDGVGYRLPFNFFKTKANDCDPNFTDFFFYPKPMTAFQVHIPGKWRIVLRGS